MEISQQNDVDRVWDTSKYHPKLFGEHIQDQSHSMLRGQGKVKRKILVLGGVMHVFGSVFRQESEK